MVDNISYYSFQLPRQKKIKKWKSRCFDSSWQLFHRSCSEEPTGTASNLDSSTIELISPVHSDALGARFWTLLWNIVRKRVELAAPQESLVVVHRCNIKRLFISTVVPEISGKSPFDFSCAISVHKKISWIQSTWLLPFSCLYNISGRFNLFRWFGLRVSPLLQTPTDYFPS